VSSNRMNKFECYVLEAANEKIEYICGSKTNIDTACSSIALNITLTICQEIQPPPNYPTDWKVRYGLGGLSLPCGEQQVLKCIASR